MSGLAWNDLTSEQRERLLALIADPEPDPEPEPPSAEHIAGRQLVDCTITRLRKVAEEMGVKLTTSQVKDRRKIIAALGGDPDAMTDAQRVKAAAAQAKREATRARRR